MSKNKLLRECVVFMKENKKAEKWYSKHLFGENQINTIIELEKGVNKGELTVKESLFLAFIVGFQWLENF